MQTGVAPTGATSCEAIGLTAGTQYIFRVDAIFTTEGGLVLASPSASSSPVSTLPGATEIACETFNYPTTSNLANDGGGIGWSGPWSK